MIKLKQFFEISVHFNIYTLLMTEMLIYFQDIFTINNILTITTPWKSFSRVESNLDWKVDFGYEYVLTVDMKYKSEQQWMEVSIC